MTAADGGLRPSAHPRPRGVAVLALVDALLGAALLGWACWPWGRSPGGRLVAATAGTLHLVLARGLWRLAGWARPVQMLIAGALVATCWGTAPAILVIFYLADRRTEGCFLGAPDRCWHAPAPGKDSEWPWLLAFLLVGVAGAYYGWWMGGVLGALSRTRFMQ